MASFIRGKQAGMQKDLSAGIESGDFEPSEQIRYGIKSQISCLAYEPVQSLLAVGTNESKFGPGNIYVFGHSRVVRVLHPPRPCSFRQLQFVADRLVSLDAKSELAIWDLDRGTRLAAYTNAGGVAHMVTDPMLDWAFLGVPSGEVTAYDLDSERPAPWRVPNLWLKHDPKVRVANLVTMQLHPRDIGTLLVAYSTGAVIYSFKQNAPVKFFEYKLLPGAPGGNGEAPDTVRKPRLTHAVWHPTGTFLLTAHDDGSLVFWDPKDGRVVMARSLYANKVDQPCSRSSSPGYMEPFVKIAWCCKQNPDDTGLLITGGRRVDDGEKGLTFIDLGPTPMYATSSWDVLTSHFEGKRQTALPTRPGLHLVDFCLVPRESPHFAGNQDPIAIISMLSSGELMTMTFPSGHPISATNQLHPSLGLVAPFATKMAVSTLDRAQWLGMEEKRQQGEVLLKGGAKGPCPRRRHEGRNVVQVSHADGTVRIWDLGRGDDMENPHQLQVDVARALNRHEDVSITAMDLASTGEFAVGTSAGEVVIYRWAGNKTFGVETPGEHQPNPGALTDISSRAEPSLKEGLQPFVLYEMMQGPITAICVSDVGFIATGSENGHVGVVDMRGPSLIFSCSVADLVRHEKKSSFLRGHTTPSSAKEWAVVIEFGVMTLEHDSYSSIACFVGTNLGRVITLKLLPQGQSYSVKFVGAVSCNDAVVSISPIVVETGAPALATGQTASALRNGEKINGALVVATQTEVRIFKPATHKGASKSFDNVVCHAAAVASLDQYNHALVALFGDRTARAFSLPGLKELGQKSLPFLYAERTAASLVARTGDIVAWTGPAEFAVLPAWAAAAQTATIPDTLINPDLSTPARPTISGLQWISGTQYMSPTDLDLLIGGPARPPSKRMLAASAEEQRLARAGGSSSSSSRNVGRVGVAAAAAAAGQEGWGEYLTRQLNERTEKLNIMGDAMDSLQNTTQGWADNSDKYVKKQKRSMLLGGITKGLF